MFYLVECFACFFFCLFFMFFFLSDNRHNSFSISFIKILCDVEFHRFVFFFLFNFKLKFLMKRNQTKCSTTKDEYQIDATQHKINKIYGRFFGFGSIQKKKDFLFF